jgi:hypothetical protein
VIVGRSISAVIRAGRSGAAGELGEVPCSSALPPARRPLARNPSDRLREVRGMSFYTRAQRDRG